MKCCRPFVFVAALLSAGAAFADNLPEGAYPERPIVAPGAGRSRADVADEAARYNEAGRPGYIPGEDRPDISPPPGYRGLTRAEVKADLEMWRRAGLDVASQGEAGPDVYSADYQMRLAQYASLRSGPVFAERVRQIAAMTGEKVDVCDAMADASSAQGMRSHPEQGGRTPRAN